MTTLWIIASCHKEIGPFSHNELLKILKEISPDIIFEELDKETFDLIYGEQRAFTLEPKAILQYLKYSNIPHIPVDTYFFSDKDIYNYGEVVKIIDKYNPEYKFIAENQLRKTFTGGFKFINSIENNKIIERLQQIEVEVLEKIGNSDYLEWYKKWIIITNERERTFINNIIKTLEFQKYRNAVFITGAEHKYALEKTLNLNTNYPNIKWKFGLN